MNQVTNDAIIKELIRAYWLELEATINYLALSVDLDGIRAEEIKKSLATDIQTEITHAQELAARIKEIDGRVPGSFAFKPEQASLQPPEDSTDLVSTIHGVIEAENMAIEQYNKIIRLCDGIDYVTQDLCIKLLADEEKHRREFRGFPQRIRERLISSEQTPKQNNGHYCPLFVFKHVTCLTRTPTLIFYRPVLMLVTLTSRNCH